MASSCTERLAYIVETAYDIVCQKIAGGNIQIYNEASLQLHLGTILKNIGQLYEFSVDDKGVSERFIIELEKPMKDLGQTAKSNGQARCDIVLAFVNGEETLAQAFLELKYFKRASKGLGSEATKDNRFGLFMDMENLEVYREKYQRGDLVPLCYEIAIAENGTYADPKAKSAIQTGNGHFTSESITFEEGKGNAVHYVSHESVRLKGDYQFCWTSYADNKHCLIVRMNNITKP